jgi:predicted nucleotidyltransferase
MNWSNPIASVIPSAHGAVLAVLAQTHEPLSGRQVAVLTRGRFQQRRVNEVLTELADSGLVLREVRPPAKLYRLNREHVAAPAIVDLATMWAALLDRIRAAVEAWRIPVDAAWLFGSTARGEAGRGSDVDVLLVHTPSTAPDGEQVWEQQVETLTQDVQAWSGNPCEVLELTRAELADAVDRGDRLVRDLLDHGIPLTNTSRRLLRTRAAG